MAKTEKKTEKAEKNEEKKGSAWQAVRKGVKQELRGAAELASLRVKLARAEKEKKALLCRLGQLTYRQLRPGKGTAAPADPEAAESLATEIEQKTGEIVDLRIRIKIRTSDLHA